MNTALAGSLVPVALLLFAAACKPTNVTPPAPTPGVGPEASAPGEPRHPGTGDGVGTAPVAASSGTSAGESFGFALYPGAKPLCGGHVTGAPQGGKPGPHISWFAHHTNDPPAVVAAHYRALLGDEGHERIDSEEIWRSPAQDPRRVLSLAPASQPGPWDECSPPRTGTVIMTSSMARPD